MRTEYKVVPAPEKARKQRGLKGAALFAHSVEALMNEMAAEGWQYLRADTLPQEERSGLTNKTTTYRNLLVFQRVVNDEATQTPPKETDAAPVIETTKPVSFDDFEDEPTDEEVVNLWDAPDEAPAPLVADRKG